MGGGGCRGVQGVDIVLFCFVFVFFLDIFIIFNYTVLDVVVRVGGFGG